jgi:hypothetical protein
MRRLFGLACLAPVFGFIACATAVEPASSNDEVSAPGVAAPVAGSRRGIHTQLASVAATGACSENITLHGTPGTVISTASVTIAYWGSYWSGAGTGERAQYDAAWSAVANDPSFYARLAEYSTSVQTIGAGSWAGSNLADPALASGTTITEAQIQAELAAEIAAGAVPRNSDARIYVVLLPPGVTSTFDEDNDFAGHHTQFTASGSSLPVRYAVITYNSDEGYNDPVISHEISEAITDPDLQTGWWDQDGEEISDICRFNYAPLDGFTIEKIFSMRACACVGAGAVTVDAGVDAATTTSCTAPAWSASATYTGGSTVSFDGSQYTAAFWNQNDEPDTHSGAAGSGRPWSLPTACSTTTCTPQCSGKTCGSDGCGGSCGACGSNQTCDVSGECVASCFPSCNLKQCGNDGCGGSCGNCGTGLTCNPNNQCVAPCVPQCNGKQCGGDTCGGQCGACGSGQTCDANGLCQANTTSSCSGVAPWNPNEPWYAYKVGDQVVGSNNHRYACKNVAYCIDDPTGSVGGTYGWTDDGGC